MYLQTIKKADNSDHMIQNNTHYPQTIYYAHKKTHNVLKKDL